MNEITIDRELLELAAKAAGVELEWDGSPDIWQPMYYQGKTYHGWNPLINDGDALRLAVNLGFDIRPAAKISTIHVWSEVLDKWVGEFYGSSCDPYAATRRAIVRVAAEIGRNMK